MKKRKKFKRNIEVLAIDGITRAARALPRGMGLRVFSLVGAMAGGLFRKARERAVRNLAIAFPDVPRSVRDALASAMFKTLGRNFYEFLKLEGSSPERLAGLVDRIEGKEHLDEAMAADEGLIAITGHIGCWELLAGYFASRGYSLNVVGRELWERRLNEKLLRVRESMGYRTIDRERGGKEVIRALRDKQVVAVLIDQHTRVSGVYVPFFGRPAHTPIGVAKLAVATGAPILPMAIYMRRSGRHEIRILPAIEIPEENPDKDALVIEITRRCSKAVEELIRYDPKQWVWFHDRWRGAAKEEVAHEPVH